MESSAVAESATTQSRTSSRIRVVEIEDESNIECHKLLAGIFDRHGTVADMDTCGAIVLTKDPKDCDGWTQQVVDKNKKCCGAKSEHLGHLFESQMVSERQIMELANIEKLKVAEVVLQEAIAQTTEIICAEWLDDVARKPEDHATSQTDLVRWRDEKKPQLVQRSEMEPARIRMEVKSFPAIKSSIQKEKNAACMSEHTSGRRRSDQGSCVEHCGRTSVLRCEAIADQTDTQKVRVTRHCWTFAGDGIVVVRAGSTAEK